MIKKPYYVLIIFIILILLLGVVFANTGPENISGGNVADNPRNTIITALNIDYGRATTQSSYVTLNLNVTGQGVDTNSLRVQFSLDNQNWSGYNPLTQKWESGFFGGYQSFYSGFYIGTDSGLKTVYVKVLDAYGNVGSASAKINFSSEAKNPHVVNPQSLELNNFQGPLAKAGIKNGSGSLYDPYVISDNNTRLVSKMPNVAEISYHMHGDVWSPWHRIVNEQADIPIIFNNVEGLKEVRLRTKNGYGAEGDAEIIYYLLDYTNPTVGLYTSYHSFTAVDGKLQFDLEVDDNASNILDFEVEVSAGGSSVIKRGKIEKYNEDKPTTISITLDGLPEGRLNLKAVVTDEAGNKGTRQVSVNSL